MPLTSLKSFPFFSSVSLTSFFWYTTLLAQAKNQWHCGQHARDGPTNREWLAGCDSHYGASCCHGEMATIERIPCRLLPRPTAHIRHTRPSFKRRNSSWCATIGRESDSYLSPPGIMGIPSGVRWIVLSDILAGIPLPRDGSQVQPLRVVRDAARQGRPTAAPLSRASQGTVSRNQTYRTGRDPTPNLVSTNNNNADGTW